jgi:hypothetical protein
MESAERYRQYAEDCRRLAVKAAAKDRTALLEIAEAWSRCAIEAEHKAETTKGNKENGVDALSNES